MRLPGLYGIRAISIALVLLYHVGASALGPDFLQHHARGVNIFFVLSGFLITYILCREEQKHGSISLKAFYLRRALRILPPIVPYLICLMILAVFGIVAVSAGDIADCLLFVRNVLPYPNFSGSAQTDHFWTLAVEEQFYLLWPLLMILLRNNRTRLKFSFLMLLVSPLWQAISWRLAGGPQFVNHARFDQMYEPILIGCCLALMRNEPGLLRYLHSPLLQSRWFAIALVVGLAAAVRMNSSPRITYIIAALFINFAVEHEGGLLNWKPVMWVGNMSYSLYIWQQLFCWDFSAHWLGRFPQNLIATFVVAALSFELVEQPFTRLRKRVRFAPNPWTPRLSTSPLPEAAAAD